MSTKKTIYRLYHELLFPEQHPGSPDVSEDMQGVGTE